MSNLAMRRVLNCANIRALTHTTLLLSWVGCGTFAVQHTAEPVPRGTWRGALVGSLQTLYDDEQRAKVPGGTLAIGVGRGMGRNSELGVTLYTLGVEAYGKVRLWHGPAGAARWSLGLLAAVGGARLPANALISPGTELHSRVVGLATVRTSSCVSWSFGPSIAGYEFLPRGGGREHGLWVGGFGNLAWQLSPRWAMVPELSVHKAASGTFPVDDQVVQLSVGWSRTW
ncbi:MAG: hypothetical protein KBG15_24655 [Kofleriaceae bacterium]|nr:hypothetical protein [Kofleriaceae bacterium]